MKAFIVFVLILLVLLGGLGGYWAWGKMNRTENWGLGLVLNSEVKEGEKEQLVERYNQILDRDEVLMSAIEAHDLAKYYGVSSNEEAMGLLKEDTFIEIKGNNALHVLFRGKRSSRKEREAAIRTMSESFLQQVQQMSGS